jgi:hypothetical protein
MSRLQTCGQKTPAEDRFLRAVQRRLFQSSIPTALEKSSVIKTRAPSGVNPAVESLRIIVSREHVGDQGMT